MVGLDWLDVRWNLLYAFELVVDKIYRIFRTRRIIYFAKSRKMCVRPSRLQGDSSAYGTFLLPTNSESTRKHVRSKQPQSVLSFVRHLIVLSNTEKF